MSKEVITEDQYVCAVIMCYHDDNGDDGQLMHTGTKEACERLADSLPAVAYSGERQVKESRVIVVPKRVWEDLTSP